MARPDNATWEMSILVGDSPGEPARPRREGVLKRLFGKEISVPSGAATRQWTETISGVVAAVNQWTASETGPWQVSEVNFGLTVGAEGKLLFIAGASAQASVEVKLTRRGS